MARMGKKTLYLDLDQLDRIDRALNKIPGKPSVSALLNDQLPALADLAEKMAAAVGKETAGQKED